MKDDTILILAGTAVAAFMLFKPAAAIGEGIGEGFSDIGGGIGGGINDIGGGIGDIGSGFGSALTDIGAGLGATLGLPSQALSSIPFGQFNLFGGLGFGGANVNNTSNKNMMQSLAIPAASSKVINSNGGSTLYTASGTSVQSSVSPSYIPTISAKSAVIAKAAQSPFSSVSMLSNAGLPVYLQQAMANIKR